MIDLSSFHDYIVDAEFASNLAEKVILTQGFEEYFNNQLNKWCNCTITSPVDGRRINQTNDLRYKIELTTTLNMIKKFGGEDEEKYYEQILKRHNENLEFEAINGFEYSVRMVNDKKKSGSTRKRTKQTSLDLGDKPKKESAAERKLKAHVAKINSFNFVIKPVNNGN